MPLPIHIQTEPGDAPVLSIDGAFDAPGLNLSHWPGNATPGELRHDLSTGIALRFARLPDARRAELAAGCTALVNNHFDTDGVCAMFCVLEPELAFAHEQALLDAASAGDFFRCPTPQAFAIDRIITAIADCERSPIRAELVGLDDRARHERATHAALARLPALLAGELEPHAALWKDALAAQRADAADLDACLVDDVVHLDAIVWSAPAERTSARTRGVGSFDPGRHALFEATRADRVLVIGPGAAGTTYRVLLSTASFFDLVSRRTQPRPDLAALAHALNELEPRDADSGAAWQHQSAHGASPELWFGTPGLEQYAEHAGEHLAPSRLEPETVKRAFIDALRATWVFPAEDDEA